MLEPRSLLKHAGIGAVLGVLLYGANAYEKPGAVPPLGLSLLLQVLGAAIGGMLIYLFGYVLWATSRLVGQMRRVLMCVGSSK